LFIFLGSIFFQDIGRLNKRRVRPQIICEKSSLYIVGGENNSVVEVFDINEGKVVKEMYASELFEGIPFKNSQFYCISTESD